MKAKILTIILMSLLMLATFSLASDDYGSDGFIMHSIEVTTTGDYGDKIPSSYAIITEETTYEPGEAVRVTLGSGVPCNTRYVYVRVENPNGGTTYSRDVSDLFSPCTTSYVQMVFTAPDTIGQYDIFLDFKDGSNQPIYTDHGIFNVNTEIVCPNAYCTNWNDVQNVENGVLQQKTCYSYIEGANQCESTASQSYRTICDAGYIQNGQGASARCVAEDGTIECGNGVLETGEACDFGLDNGVCPAACNNFCQVSSCEDLPVPDPEDPDPTNPTPKLLENGELAIGLVLVLVGLILYTRKGKK